MLTPQQRFRTLMGRFVTGVTVIAARTEDGVAAITANAVTAVSLDPLLLLVCVRNESRLLPIMLQKGAFSVNVLAAGQDDISRHYGGSPQDQSPAQWILNDMAPVLVGANASFACRVDTAHRAGDHTVIYGAVVEMAAADPVAPALIYAAGKYGDVALAA
ncbi:MAG: flavin reductase [Rhodopseudomonas sp.]|uniref:flavin reductase family protein n=1 Tax=Rhodopseudomonas sp. TaxID=1078 RepID=UPI0017F0AA23|nr:flavin reductase family protein [Rhodopseudomonas sp.]NVN88300.1 flavin reductase [Rhodopseudomonas sp.]